MTVRGDIKEDRDNDGAEKQSNKRRRKGARALRTTRLREDSYGPLCLDSCLSRACTCRAVRERDVQKDGWNEGREGRGGREARREGGEGRREERRGKGGTTEWLLAALRS